MNVYTEGDIRILVRQYLLNDNLYHGISLNAMKSKVQQEIHTGYCVLKDFYFILLALT